MWILAGVVVLAVCSSAKVAISRWFGLVGTGNLNPARALEETASTAKPPIQATNQREAEKGPTKARGDMLKDWTPLRLDFPVAGFTS